MAVLKSIGELPRECAKRYGNKTALVFKDKSFSFADLDTLSDRMGNSLRSLGVGKGDRVSIYSQNCWEWIVAYYGILKLGAVVNPVNVMLTPEEVLYVVNDCGASVLVTSTDKAPSVLRILGEAKTLRHVVVYGDDAPAPAQAFNRLLEQGASALAIEPCSPADLSTIGYTSGTTGHPKGAMLTHRGVLLNSQFTATLHLKTRDDVVVTSLPTAHVYGNVVMNGTFLAGGTLVLVERFHEETVLESMETWKATVFEGVPAMYIMLLNQPSLGKYNLSSLRVCTVGGQTISVPVMKEVENRFGCPLIELWGMTEISGLGTTHPFYGENRHGSIGIPLPGCEARIADPADPAKTLGPDQPGELLIRGPIVMKGYYGKPEATRETIEPDGWLHTGDIARMDADGYIYVVDRLKDMILTGGYNIYPAEIERVLQQHPAVAMVAVGPVADAVKGELAKAYIVLKDGTHPAPEEILSFCREHLAPYKVPRMVQFVQDLPKTSTGKIMRRELRKLDAGQA